MENGNTLPRAPIALPREKNCCDKWGRSSLTGKIRKLLLNSREGIKRRTKYGANCYQKICQTTISGGKMTWRGRDVNWREELVLLHAFWLVNDVSYMFLLSASPKCLTTTREARVRLSSERLPVGMVTWNVGWICGFFLEPRGDDGVLGRSIWVSQ